MVWCKVQTHINFPDQVARTCNVEQDEEVPVVDLFLDADQRRGATKALFLQLRDGILSGRFAAGDRLPASRELASQLGISRHTVTTVYGRLVAEGFAEGHAGGGTI